MVTKGSDEREDIYCECSDGKIALELHLMLDDLGGNTGNTPLEANIFFIFIRFLRKNGQTIRWHFSPEKLLWTRHWSM